MFLFFVCNVRVKFELCVKHPCFVPLYFLETNEAELYLKASFTQSWFLVKQHYFCYDPDARIHVTSERSLWYLHILKPGFRMGLFGNTAHRGGTAPRSCGSTQAQTGSTQRTFLLNYNHNKLQTAECFYLFIFLCYPFFAGWRRKTQKAS